MIHECDLYRQTVEIDVLLLNAILADEQIYNGQWLMPMYSEGLPYVGDQDAIDAQLALNDVLMFGGNR
jgi:hypothetical protein